MIKVREPRPGEILGQNYLIEKELGRGGFGVVYKARHIDIDRIVAIKVLLATYAAKDESAKERFKREATIAASLDYPNSLRIFDYGQTDEGVFYIVMEFIQGKDLGKTLQQETRLPIPRAIHIIRQVLHALMEAHARGIVHRDIKPDNVMLVPLAYDPDFVKVMDFGIAKMVDSGEQITKAGMTLGTPRYMPVEQLKGERLGPATDLYATGLVLYEMLVGRPAFTGETAVDTALAVMRGDPVRVPLDTGVPEPLRQVIEKASARHAEDRFQNARAFLEALNALPGNLLDLDVADRERFAAEGMSAAARRMTTAELEIDRLKGTRDGDFEDAIKTQAISTNEVLSAKPPKRSLSPDEREAATEAIDVASVTPSARPTPPALPPRPGSVLPSVLVDDSGRTVMAPAGGGETSMVELPGRAPVVVAAPRKDSGIPQVLLVLNAAILILVVIMLLRSL